MPTYKTPDVYVEEISILPPSVAEVSTAVPAFIGYTGKAERNGKNLLKKPVRINSFKEFQEIFGDRAPKIIKAIRIDAQKQVSGVTFERRFYLYDALYMYFLNGGGSCYIVSIGNYNATPADGKELTLAAIDSLEAEDEITLIVMPDLVSLGGGMYSVQQAALAQCAKLKNRFSVLDIKEPARGTITDWTGEIKTFRDRIGIMNLSYGAAYTPYVIADISVTVTYPEIANFLFKDGSQDKCALEDLDASESTISTVANLKNALLDKNEYTLRCDKIPGPKSGNTRRDLTQALEQTQKKPDEAARKTAREQLFNGLLTEIYHAWSPAPPAPYKPLSDNIRQHVRDALTGAVSDKILKYDDFFNANFTEKAQTTITATAAAMAESLGASTEHLDALISVLASVYAAMESNISRYEASLASQSPLYRSIKDSVAKALCTMPPSAAVAGLYAQTDRQRGVWKAPANVSLSTTQGLSQSITSAMQEDLNVDTNAGKSINALRAFPGKGILVWGARTLDGNNNEWRYVPVRRFFIMAEESIRRASFWAVFEPNDANLWVKVKAMIENYLLEKWKDGALAGAAPADAFYVNVGLGSTMTSQDILEGRLIVDIGMAVVRPAEFIILRFMHKMQQS